jgi:hypothetical protein
MLTAKAFSDIVTFSRSSNATRIGPTGRVEYAPHNLLLRSQEFDNAAWSKNASTITANAAIAPDGTVTADKLVENSSNDGHYALNLLSGTNGTIYTASVYLKMAERRYAVFDVTDALTGGIYVYVDLQTGVITQSATAAGSWTGASASITSVGNGWYRVSITGKLGANNTAAPLVVLSNSPTGGEVPVYTGDGTSGIYLWGAQLSVGPYPLDYTPTTSAAVYGPRFDYDPVTLAARGLLIEEQRTNLLVRSEEFDNAAWTKSLATVTSNSTESPSGTITADTITFTGAFGDAFNFTAVNPASSAYTGSVWLKGSGSLIIRISNNVDQQFTTTVNLTSTFTRYTVSGTFNSTPGTLFFAISRNDLTATSVVVWGAQLEAGSFATSYIPTIASTVTRSSDVASVNTLSPWFNATEGTLFAEAAPLITNSGAARGVFGLSSGSYSNSMSLYMNGFGALSGGYIVNGGSDQADLTLAYNNKTALAYKLNDVNMGSGGVVATTDTSATIPTINQVQLGDIYGGTSFKLNGHLRRIAVYPRRLTNAELQALTA